MLYVQSPQKREFFVELLDGNTYSGVTFKHEKTEGMKVYFSYEGDVDVERAIRIIKNAVRDTDYGKILYFAVFPAE